MSHSTGSALNRNGPTVLASCKRLRSYAGMNSIDIDRDDFRAWFQGSKAVDETGQPTLVFRGEHGERDSRLFQSRHGALSFGDLETACLYATEPNDHGDRVHRPRIMPAYLNITNPIVNTPSDPFVDLSRIEEALGRAEAVRLAHKFASKICDTGYWYELERKTRIREIAEFIEKYPRRLGELYFQAFDLLNDSEEVARLREASYDGGIHCGFGENGTEVEMKVFNPSQVWTATSRWLTIEEARVFAESHVRTEHTEMPGLAP